MSGTLAESAPEPSKPRVRTAELVITSGVVALAAWWAFMKPLPGLGIEAAGDPAPLVAMNQPLAHVALDTTAFHAPLWIAPPPPAPTVDIEATPPHPPPPAPLKVQLLAVARDERGEKALVYDPDTDRPSWVRPGEALGSGSRTVGAITAEGIQVRDGSGVRMLTLNNRPNDGSSFERLLRKQAGGAK